MTRSIKREIQCHCGKCFEATLYESVNVKLNPELKRELLDGRLNVVICPACGQQRRLEIPLLYHDMERRIAIWIFPEDMKGQVAEIEAQLSGLDSLLRARVGEVIANYLNYCGKPHLVFGRDKFVQLLVQLERGNH